MYTKKSPINLYSGINIGGDYVSYFFTNENCIGCNKCVKSCGYVGANKKVYKDDKERIEINPDICVSCGACRDICKHGARDYEDDTDRFIKDLKKGEDITVIFIAPMMMHYPKEFMNIFGGLNKLGVKRFINGACGMTIFKWAALNYMIDNNIRGGITNQCSAVMEIIEKHIPKLIPKLIPVHSPVMCSAIYAKKYIIEKRV